MALGTLRRRSAASRSRAFVERRARRDDRAARAGRVRRGVPVGVWLRRAGAGAARRSRAGDDVASCRRRTPPYPRSTGTSTAPTAGTRRSSTATTSTTSTTATGTPPTEATMTSTEPTRPHRGAAADPAAARGRRGAGRASTTSAARRRSTTCCGARGENVGLSTVYRTLQALADAGEVDVLRTEDGEAVYRRCSRDPPPPPGLPLLRPDRRGRGPGRRAVGRRDRRPSTASPTSATPWRSSAPAPTAQRRKRGLESRPGPRVARLTLRAGEMVTRTSRTSCAGDRPRAEVLGRDQQRLRAWEPTPQAFGTAPPYRRSRSA